MDAFLQGRSGIKPKAAPAAAVPATPQFVPWVEKYRPRTVNEVSHQDEVVAVLKKCLEGDDIPNFLFYGPPGTGKTSTILALTRQMFGVEYKNRVLELNASDERGIQVVRDKIKNFAQLAAFAKTVGGLKIPGIKMVILDEADSMTNAAQSALRRTMEKYTKTTRFCLICNYVSRIIAPITSRCAKFRFKPLDTTVLDDRIKHICKEEKVTCGEDVIEVIRKVSGGDLRKAITYLQSSARLKVDEEVTTQDIHDIAGVVPQEVVERVLELAKSGNYTKLQHGIEDLMHDAYSASQILEQLHDMVLEDGTLPDKQKSVIMEEIAKTDKRLLDGGDEYLQIMSLVTVVMSQYTDL
ncbi:replication factor C subunit 4-like [Bolinopsis microptera]|uniref:replication factor C subunit 4-like n=1 Tax=Bolinopsis microptera TaxID=2820187 RepID=UPI00307945E2